jgi:hypothetical protein
MLALVEVLVVLYMGAGNFIIWVLVYTVHVGW